MIDMKKYLDGDESVVLKQKTMWFEKKVQAFAGDLYATTRRVIFDQEPLSTPSPGIMGRFFPKLKERHDGGIRVNIDIASISKLEKTTFGKGSYLNIYREGADKPLKFMVDHYAEWEKVLDPNLR